MRLAGSRVAELAVIPIYYLRTGVWPSSEKADALIAIPEIKCPILFIGGGRDRICPPENTRLMYNAASNPRKELLIVPNAEHDTTHAAAPRLYEANVARFLERALAD